VGIRCADHDTLYHQKLALTSLTSDGRSVSIVCSRSKTKEFVDGEGERMSRNSGMGSRDKE
jgi:hypothetical protein